MASRILYLVLCCYLIATSSAQTVNVSFEETSYNVSESAGSLDLRVIATPSAGAPDMVTVTIRGFPGADPMDFNINSSGIQFLTFDVINDNVLGNDRTFEVTLNSSGSGVMIDSPSMATVNIAEDDMVMIGFDATQYTVFEGEDVRVCVSLQSGILATDRNVVVTLATDDMFGSGGMSLNMDFTSLSVDLTFSNATTTQCEDVSTTFTADIPAMPFNVSLTTSEAPTAVSLNPSVTTVTIQDVMTPNIVMQPESMDGVFPDSNVTFTVIAMGGALSYQWSMNGDEIPGETQATLTLVGVGMANEGIYSCFISNRAGNVTTDNVSLTVLRQPTISLIHPNGALLNEEISITCTAIVNANIMLMVVDSAGENVSLTDVETTGNSSSVNLRVMSLGRHNITCIADNQGLAEMETGQFDGITIEVTDVTAGITATAIFFCNVTGATGGVTYMWRQTQNGTTPFPDVVYEDRVSGSRTATLEITNLTDVEQNYNYICFVFINDMEIGSATGTLTSPGPQIVLGPQNQMLQATDTLVLNCTGKNNIDATQPLRINWMFTSFNIQNQQRLYTVSDPEVTEMRLDDDITVTSVLTINNVQPTNGGVYDCLVFNRDMVQPVIANATVNVFFTPQINFVADRSMVPVGGNTQLTCTITAEPVANSSQIVRIMSNGDLVVEAEELNPDGVREFDVTYMFNRVNFPEDDGAIFQCRATNDNGLATQNITIIVQAPPGAINHTNGDVTAELVSLDSVKVTWRIPPNNNADITSYTLTFCAMVNATDCGSSVNVTVMLSQLTRIGDNQLSYIYDELLTEKMYEVVIRAENSIGLQMAPALGNGLNFDSAFPDDGRVVNVGFIPTINTIIVTWNLPVLALNTTNLDVSFDVVYYNVSKPLNRTSVSVEYNPMRLEQGFSANVTMSDSPSYVFQIVARYNNPNLLSSQANLTDVRTLADGATLLTGPQAVVTEDVQGNVLTVSWPTPSNTNFLVAYRVSYSTSTSSARSRRQTTQTREVPTGTTSTTLDFAAFTDYTVNVDAIYAPPPDGNNVTVNLLPPTMFTTPQRPPSPPLGIVAANETLRKVRLTWNSPSDPRGIVTRYRVTINLDGGETLVDGMTTFLSGKLSPNTVYTYTILAINGAGDGEGSPPMMFRTNFGVVQPVISSTAVGNAGAPRFTISTDRFDDDDGGLGLYKVVVVRGNRVDPDSIPDSQLAPLATSQFNYYVAYVGNARQQSSTFVIGDGSTTTDGPVTFTNPPPDTGVNYFVFIRLYSSINGSVFANSELTGILMIATPLNPAVIIAPIAVIAVLLLIILVVLLVVVFLFTRPRRGYTIAATGEDGVHRKKRGGALELRRTRLFSPVVNVPVPDVFTSAGQPTTLVCEASGTPAPEVVWTQNNEPLDKERFIQLADSSLFVNDTDLKDEGAYIVTATNSAGTAEQMVRVTVIRPSPPEPDPDHPPIKVGEFTEKIALLRADDDEGLEDEYTEVEPDVTFTSYAAKININKNKNRYINIIPYDHSRVVLTLQDNTPGSDYINASYIDGFNRPNAYIATQGPQPSTFPDFWRMVWEFDCPTIVMVTNLKEEDKLKCHQYWPNYGTTTYGNVQVTLKGVENLAEYSIRTFHITPIAGQSRVQMPVREVKQFHFLVWPDHGVPQFATPLLSFRKRVAKYHPDKKGPMVVHCSAGVGRTGTFITIDTMLRQMEAESVIDIFNFVRHMRFRRNYMVQTAPQYVFIHDALLEAIMCGDNSIPAPELRKRFPDLMEVDPESNKSRLQLQFENLNSNSPQDDDFDSTIASLPDNMAKNRFKVHLPANDFRVPLGAPPSRSEGGDEDNDDEDEKEKEKEEPDYICASFADGYRQRNAFIITQAPMSNTTGDFWKMIWEQKSAAIVMLTELEEDGKEMSVKYWPGEVGEASLFGSFQLELSEDEKDKGDYVTRKFKLSHVDAPQECRIVTQFHFTKWPRSSTPSNPHSVIDLIDEIQRVQRKSGNQPITIHCDDGVSRTGAFCTLYCVLERVKVDQVVDVYLATKTLRIQRAGLLETLDQYVFVHKAVIEFLDSFSDYQNFK